MKFVALPNLALMFVMIICLGCGKSVDVESPVEVHGVITLDGQPLANGSVGFNAISQGLPAKYRFVSTSTDAAGTFMLPSVYPAQYEVTLSQTDPSAPVVQDAAVAGNPKLAKYATNSPLRADVSADSTTFKFDVTSK